MVSQTGQSQASCVQMAPPDPFISPQLGALCENSAQCLHEFVARQPRLCRLFFIEQEAKI
jgi:hypothetical protein